MYSNMLHAYGLKLALDQYWTYFIIDIKPFMRTYYTNTHGLCKNKTCELKTDPLVYNV